MIQAKKGRDRNTPFKTTLDEYIKERIVTVIGDEIEFLPGTKTIETSEGLNNIKLSRRDAPDTYNLNEGQDLNESAGGEYICLVQQWEYIE